MLRFVTGLDRAVGSTRPLWQWLGQAGLVLLGVHLAADRLDDLVYEALLAVPQSWVGAEQLASVAAWGAVALELVVVLKVCGALLLTARDPQLSWRQWWNARSVDAWLMPVFWGATALAGAWTVGMSVEDLLADQHATGAMLIGWLVAALMAWRLGWTGWKRVVGAFVPGRFSRGLGWAVAVAPLTLLTLMHGLPVWSLVPQGVWP